jgi:Family of unknown function (DUF6364)
VGLTAIYSLYIARNLCPHKILEAGMNLTLSVDEKIVESARRAAQILGKSLNQIVRDYLEQLAGGASLQSDLAEFRDKSTKGNSGGVVFSRDDVYAQRLDRYRDA